MGYDLLRCAKYGSIYGLYDDFRPRRIYQQESGGGERLVVEGRYACCTSTGSCSGFGSGFGSYICTGPCICTGSCISTVSCIRTGSYSCNCGDRSTPPPEEGLFYRRHVWRGLVGRNAA